jgi:hypothetical protein
MSEKMENTGMSSIWELYGVRENPFSTSPLLVKGGTLPIESFVGRQEQVDRLLKLFTSKGGSRILVCGDIGVGKTTFVNYARRLTLEKGFFTPFKEIAPQASWTTDVFILNTLAGIHSTMKLLDKAAPISPENFKKLESVVEMGGQEINFGNKVGEENLYVSQGVNRIRLTTFGLHDLFQNIIGDILERTKRDVIIHYDNLELLSEKNIRNIFDNLRDFLQTPNVHFVFVGNLSVKQTFNSLPRVNSIMSDTPILLGNLKLKEVDEIIKIRLEKTQINELSYVKPFDKVVLEELYELYEGNIRDILNSLSTAIVEATKEKPVVLDEFLISKTLKSVVERRYLEGLQPKAKEILLEVVKHKEITNSNLSANTKTARSNISTYLGDLQNKGCVYLRRKSGKDKYWSADPKIKWLLLREPDTIQKRVIDYIPRETKKTDERLKEQ